MYKNVKLYYFYTVFRDDTMNKSSFFVFVLLFSVTIFDISAQIPDSVHSLRILTFNVYHGETMKGDFDLDLIARVINNCDPDLVALQEIDVHTRRSKQMDIATELALRTKMISYFGQSMAFDGGFYGVAILSKRPAIKIQNHPLPYSDGREPRTALEAHFVVLSGDTIRFISTHLDHIDKDTDRIKQTKELDRIFSNDDLPTILAGDLNAIPDSRTMHLLLENWQRSFNEDIPTAPTKDPRYKIDYILYRPSDSWQVIGTKVIDERVASDHYPVLGILQLNDISK